MKYYEALENGKIRCLLCRHHCILKDGQVGICGVNMNKNGELVNLVYGHPSSINVDPIEKKPLFHFLPGSGVLSFGTVGCNFKCPFCQNWQIAHTNKVNDSVYVSPQEMVKLALEYNCKSIAYTYNEPSIFYPYARDVGVLAKEKGLKNVFVTNGFESVYEIEDMKDWVDACNVDLKSFKPEYYKKVLKGNLEDVLDTIKRLHDVGIWQEITTLIVPQDNDSEEELTKIAEFIASVSTDIPWHISRFHPDYKVQDKPATPMETMIKAYEIGKKAGLKYVYLGNVALPVVTYCPKCNEELIVRTIYRVEKNILQIDNQGVARCPTCGEVIPGVWK
ncbi:AmmeMemoRadiSam system radical SAM enzyme [Caminibacter pacificus]|uniref:AmmeMemoRadiSam system radical SAM enzyme n=1 Tax=Caminibacter pacificus TaxID=1424653 RepID=A0AAJ4RDU4_9BACT|nr:AmmeMemoRadiSam system radical SAM enzyme [Caminibacter pacificus]QCI28484.1 AmmeMemoRadiSam system radical SAM enzyme [Caminibacter pacificus]ROR40788.1 pyruvate formate lyase activating enzyme [Caminibacter pacificus]